MPLPLSDITHHRFRLGTPRPDLPPRRRILREAGRQKAQTEWCPHTKLKLQEQDPTIYDLINNSEYAFPTSKMPIANYGFRSITLSDISYF